jgi:hypothetical protein
MLVNVCVFSIAISTVLVRSCEQSGAIDASREKRRCRSAELSSFSAYAAVPAPVGHLAPEIHLFDLPGPFRATAKQMRGEESHVGIRNTERYQALFGKH